MARAPIFRNIFSAGRNVLGFLLGLVTVCAGLNALLPSLYVSGLSDKLEYLRQHRGEIDTVFVGSSRVYHAFDPQRFDAEMKSRGVETHSFNLGIDGMRPPESLYVLRELLKLKLPLRRVFFELVDIHPKVNAANIGSARYMHWHDGRDTVMVLRHVFRSSEEWDDRVEESLVHAGCFAVRLSNFGRGPDWLSVVLAGPPKNRRLVQAWESQAGFEAQLSPQLAGVKRANYQTAVTFLQSNSLAPTPLPPLLATALQDALQAVRQSGAQPVLVISPTVLRNENFTDLATAKIDAPLIAFNDPRKYPAIFDPANHCDEQHLNAVGAAEYSRALAEEFAALAAKPPIQSGH